MTITIDLTKAAQVLIFGGFLWAVSALSPGHSWGWLRHEQKWILRRLGQLVFDLLAGRGQLSN
ncbi:hypothetical protein P4161_02525 [Pseudomonas aeruginosa]|nr:hypothetical protein [Pseudomonas aeruginosa]